MGKCFKSAEALALIMNAMDLILIFDVVLLSTRGVLEFYSSGR